MKQNKIKWVKLKQNGAKWRHTETKGNKMKCNKIKWKWKIEKKMRQNMCLIRQSDTKWHKITYNEQSERKWESCDKMREHETGWVIRTQNEIKKSKMRYNETKRDENRRKEIKNKSSTKKDKI